MILDIGWKRAFRPGQDEFLAFEEWQWRFIKGSGTRHLTQGNRILMKMPLMLCGFCEAYLDAAGTGK